MAANTFKRSLNILVPLMALAGLPSQWAYAEGAVRQLDCRIERTCNAAGACTATSGEARFDMTPQSLAADGSGDYTLMFDGKQAPMHALSEAGPFYWQVDEERHTLVASSETRFLWHRLSLQNGPVADILFLACRFTQ